MDGNKVNGACWVGQFAATPAKTMKTKDQI